MIKSDISFWLSGGNANSNPKKSLGGIISKYQANEDNLLDDITIQEALSGSITYRCFYLVNDNKDEKLKNLEIYIEKGTSGAEIQLGVALNNEIQAIVVSGQPPRGFFQIVYTLKQGGKTFINQSRLINWTPDASQVADAIQGALNSSDNLHDVKCVGSATDNGYDFLITFPKGRQQELLGVINEVGVNMSVMRVQSGGPINLVAPNIGFDTNTPNNVKFYDSSKDNPVDVGVFFPSDFLPIWIKRTVLPNTKSIHDKFNFNMMGDSELISSTKPHTIDTIKSRIKSSKMFL